MKCQNFGCPNESAYPFVCCDKYCGWDHRGNLDIFRKYQAGIVDWKYLKDGLTSYWTIEKCEYYFLVYK